MNETQICIRALRIASPTERAAFLDQACAHDELRRRVEAQLKEVEQDAGTSAPFRLKTDTPPPGGSHPGDANSDLEPARLEAAPVPRAVPRSLPADAFELPGYSIDSELARGGMGVVYKAIQQGLNRPVALKMILGADRADAMTLSRFLSEAEAVASIRHPNVVQVYEYGESAGLPYLAMEFCAHGTLSDLLKAGRMEPRAAAALVEKLARGVQVAHEMGIVHRDLKPGNVLFDADDQPKIADFGLAKRGTRSDLTGTGMVMGTPAYMAPEQAKGETKFVGPSADIWALGVIVYECLCGVRPFDGEDSWSVLQQVIHREPAALRTRVRTIPRDLEMICRKCLAKDPKDRYPNAHELAEDLRRYLSGQTVRARQAPAWERGWRWCRRRPAAAGLLVVLCLVTATSTVLTWMWREVRHRDELDRAESRRQHEFSQADLRHQQEVNELAFRDYLRTVDAIAEIAKNLKDKPGGQEVQMRLFLEIRKSYERFRDRWSGDPSIEGEVARSQYRLGHSLSVIGKRSEAIREYEEAITIQERLRSAEPKDHAAKRDLAKTYLNLGKVLAEAGKNSDALKSFDRAKVLFDDLVRIVAPAPDDQSNLAITITGVGFVLDAQGKLDAAIQSYERARDILARLVHQFPSEVADQQDLARAENNIGAAHHRAGRLTKALEAYERARAIRARLAELDRSDPSRQFDLAVTLMNAGIIQLDEGLSLRRGETRDPKKGSQSVNDAIRILAKLVPENDAVPDYKHSLAKCRAVKLLLDAESVPQQEIISYFRRAQETLEELISDGLDVPETSQLLGNCYVAIALRETDPMEAERLMTKGHEILAGLAKKDPSNPDYTCDTGWSLHLLAKVRGARGHTDLAVTTYEDAVRFQKSAVKRGNEVVRYRRELSSTYADFAEMDRTRGQVERAICTTLDRRTLWEADPDELYDAACDFGRSMLAAKTTSLREKAALYALVTLEQAARSGFSDWSRIQKEKDLALVRTHSKFEYTLKQMQNSTP